MPPRSPEPPRWLLGAGAIAAVLLLASASLAQIIPPPAPVRLKKLTIEELMSIEVVSVSRHAEKLGEVASGIRVISGDEIRRSGAVTIPQALRLASNLHAAQVSPGYWTIGARGFNMSTTTSNKLLVMVDGRSVYTPLISGTYWDSLDVFLPDVDRIEVISGPGGSAWGANAVNGVINLLTRSAADTQGSLLFGGAGIEERAYTGFRHGGPLGRVGHYRVYGKHLDLDASVRPNGMDSRDRWVFSQIGFRTDTRWWERVELTLQGDLYTGWLEQAASSRGEFDGGNLLARSSVPLSENSKLRAQLYYASARRGAPHTFADRIDTIDVDLQHELQLEGGRQTLIWGLGHRVADDRVRNLPTQAFIPADFIHRLRTAFVHYELHLIPDQLRLTVGTKYEHNNYSGDDHQPNVRLAWTVAPQQTLWTAVSRAVRTPSRVDRDLHIPPQPPFTAAGGPNFGSERLWAYELGWRGHVGEQLSGSVTAYFHDYGGLRTLEQPVPLMFANGLDASTYGTEVFLRHELVEHVSWSLGYTLLKRDFELKPWSRDFNAGRVEEADPEHQVHLRTAVDLPNGWEFDLAARYVGPVPTLAARVQTLVPAYTELEARLGWQSRRGLEISVVGTNLLDRAHPETGAAPSRREIQRSLHARFIWRF